LKDELSVEERARDFDRITVPGGFLMVLKGEYWQGPSPKGFEKAVKSYRKRYDFHARSRRWRHMKRWGKKSARSLQYKDVWLWDEKSAQASVVMSRSERKKCYPLSRNVPIAKGLIKGGAKAWTYYGQCMEQAYQRPVELKGRIGMSLEMVDFDSREVWQETVAYVKELAEQGHEVMLAILQNRKAVLNPVSWERFLKYVVTQTAGQVQMIEVCHAVNRSKWGLWSAQEQAQLLQPLVELKKEYPAIQFTGPACIDFEYHYVFGALEALPEDLAFDALSHHLYVDRRGAPENKQGKFSLLEKCALLKSIALSNERCGDEVIVSETNWPVEVTGEWSPVDATYCPSWRNGSSLGVSEDLYGSYMLRYLVISLCSGLVERVYWWRLVSHGFGLVDEMGEDGWRERPAYKMLSVFLDCLGESTFVKMVSVSSGVEFYMFQKMDECIVLSWFNGGEISFDPPFKFKEVRSCLGDAISGGVMLNDSPVYFHGVSNCQGGESL